LEAGYLGLLAGEQMDREIHGEQSVGVSETRKYVLWHRIC
jgi:hypothetical protein